MHIYESGTNIPSSFTYKRFVYGRKFMDRPAGSFGFFFLGFWEELFGEKHCPLSHTGP